MKLFLVVFHGKVPLDIIEQLQPLVSGDFHHASAQTLLVHTFSADPSMISDAIDRVTNNQPAAVFKLNGAYAGRYYPDLWQWLKERREQIDG